MTATASQQSRPAGLAADPTATVTVSIMGSNGVQVDISNASGQPLTAQDVILTAARVLDLPAFSTNDVGVVRNGQPAQLTDAVQPDDLVSTAPRVSNG